MVRQTIKVPVVGDGLYELDESFAFVLSQPVNAELGLARALGNIVSVDPSRSCGCDPSPRRREMQDRRSSASNSSWIGPRACLRGSIMRRPMTRPRRPRIMWPPKAHWSFPGQTLGTVTVTVNGDTAVEPNEMFLLALSDPQGLRFTTVPPAPAIGTIVNEDAVAGLATAFRWQGLPATVEAGTPFPAQIQALDGFLNPVSAFNGVLGIEAYAGPGRPSHVILTEIAINSGRGVELQNVSAEVVDVSGWKVYFYDPTPVACAQVHFHRSPRDHRASVRGVHHRGEPEPDESGPLPALPSNRDAPME